MRLTPVYALIFGFLLSTTAAAAEFQVQGLKTPESFIVDPQSGEYYLSNVNGQPLEKDNNGFITRLDPQGKVLKLRFIDQSIPGVTLNAPKGLAIIGNALYATDIDTVRAFDKKTGKPLRTIDVSAFGPKFLNDLVADGQGNLYVSDMTAQMILRIDTAGDVVALIALDPDKGGPNGLVIHPKTGHLLVAMGDSGQIAEVTPESKLRTYVKHPDWKNLDGLAAEPDGTLYVSSFTGGKVYRIGPDLKVTVFREGLRTPADIGLDLKNRLLLIPSFEGNQARAVTLETKAAPKPKS